MTMSRLQIFMSHTADELAGYVSGSGLTALREQADLVFNDTGRVLQDAELAHAAAGCQVILAHRSTPGRPVTFEASPQLLAFMRFAVDASTIDIASASAHGILVTRTSAGFGVAVAELALAMMLDLARGVSRARRDFEHGRTPNLPKGLQLRGAAVGILGYGVIGKELATMAQALGMAVRVFDPRADSGVPDGMTATLAEAAGAPDFVVCLAASVPETRNLVDAKFLARMKRGACFLNLSRGELVDEDALEQALDSGHLRGVGLDVGRAPDQQPSARFLNRQDVVVMPHAGGMTVAAREHQTQDTVRQIAALARRQWPEGSVNAQSAERVREYIAHGRTA